MTSIGFHPSHSKKLTIIAEKYTASSGSKWIDIKIMDGTREIGEITVYEATSIEVVENAE